jgi:hypothetical protein
MPPSTRGLHVRVDYLTCRSVEVTNFVVTRNLRDVARMELRFPELRVMSPEDFLKEMTA